jgi:hypothetical protein
VSALLGEALSHVVESWETATSGSEAPLRAIATEQAVETLLRPGDEPAKPKLVLRDAELVRWDIKSFDPDADPPRVRVSLIVRGVRFVIDERTGSRIAGSPTVRNEMRPTWVLELDDQGPTQWRLVSSSNPADDLPFVGEIDRR